MKLLSPKIVTNFKSKYDFIQKQIFHICMYSK